MSEKNDVIALEKSNAQRFTALVMKEYNTVGSHEFSDHEKRLIGGYFIAIDQTLAKAESDRIKKNEWSKSKNTLPYSWQTIDLQQLAVDLAHYSRVGLDMQQDNVLFPIPYKDNKANRYTMTLMEGYNGIRYQAEKYATIPFKGVTTEVVYSKDKFSVIKKDHRNPVEGYELKITDPFDRGDPVGAFGYIEYENPENNKLIVMSKKDIEKRRPRYASPEFWGGEKTVYEGGKPVKTVLEGWVPEMWLKTIKREVYGAKHIPRDPLKIDESYQYIKGREAQYASIAIEAEVLEEGNKEPLAFGQDVVDAGTGEIVQESGLNGVLEVPEGDSEGSDEVPNKDELEANPGF